MAPGDRARILRRFAEVVDAHIEPLAELELKEAYHPLGNARWERATSAICCTTRPGEWSA